MTEIRARLEFCALGLVVVVASADSVLGSLGSPFSATFRVSAFLFCFSYASTIKGTCALIRFAGSHVGLKVISCILELYYLWFTCIVHCERKIETKWKQFFFLLLLILSEIWQLFIDHKVIKVKDLYSFKSYDLGKQPKMSFAS